ncbi:uncharacterized protein LOC131044348 isoform X2 [Cryptomeria japonica]|uniref:uncharacterized protein LOC131044348 isoform X2 n=1 Tax=Cryptomeria japonica TaxID=3369 RepID=UPI0027DA9EA1|nr:uncharacterized protein LOC131044348 isoform X2 [Cryptomeria japonica]
MESIVVEEIDVSERAAEVGDDGGRRSLQGSARYEINENAIEMGLKGVGVMPNDAFICSYSHGDPKWIATSLVSPLPSDIIAPPLSNYSSMLLKEEDMDKSQQHQHSQKQVFIRYGLQILFGPNVANVTNENSALYIDLPSNMLGSFFMGWVGVAFKRNISIFSEALAIGLSSGLMGSITTFTSWMQAMVNLATKGHWIIGIIGLLLGMELAQMSLELGIDSTKLITYAHIQIKKKQLVLTWMPSSEHYQCGLCGFILVMFIFAILWGGSLVLLVFNFTSQHKTKLWMACMVGPFGVWARWYMARLNGQGIGAKKHLKWLPIGTLLTNLMTSIIMAALSTIHQVVKDRTGKIMIESLQLGFLGCMSTVSAFVVEVRAMHQSNHSWRAYVYILLSLFPAFIFGILICSIPTWSRGYS